MVPAGPSLPEIPPRPQAWGPSRLGAWNPQVSPLHGSYFNRICVSVHAPDVGIRGAPPFQWVGCCSRLYFLKDWGDLFPQRLIGPGIFFSVTFAIANSISSIDVWLNSDSSLSLCVSLSRLCFQGISPLHLQCPVCLWYFLMAVVTLCSVCVMVFSIQMLVLAFLFFFNGFGRGLSLLLIFVINNIWLF